MATSSTIGLNDLANAIGSDLLSIDPSIAFRNTSWAIADNLAATFDYVLSVTQYDPTVNINTSALYRGTYFGDSGDVVLSIYGSGVDKLFGGSSSIGKVYITEINFSYPAASYVVDLKAAGSGIEIDFNAGINDGTSFFGGTFNSFSFTTPDLSIVATGSIDFFRYPDTGQSGINGTLSSFTISYLSDPNHYTLTLGGEIHFTEDGAGNMSLGGSKFSSFSVSEAGNYFTYTGNFTCTGDLKTGYVTGSITEISGKVAGATFDIKGSVGDVYSNGHEYLSGYITDMTIHASGTDSKGNGYDATYSFTGKNVDILGLFDQYGNMRDLNGDGKNDGQDIYKFLSGIDGAILTGINMPPTAYNDTNATDNKTALHVDAAHGILANDTDPDAGETLYVSSVNGWDGGVGYYYTIWSGPLLAVSYKINSDGSYDFTPGPGLSYLALGQSITGYARYAVSDGHGNSSDATLTITVTGANHAPTVSGPVTNSASEGASSYPLNLLINAYDQDGDAMSVGSVTYKINNVLTGNSGHDVPAGLALNSNTLTVDPTNSAFNSLGVGASKILEVDYTISDGHGGTVAQVATITINGMNDSPAASALTSSPNEGAASYQIDLLSSVSDPDTGDTVNLGSVQPTYKIDGVLTGSSGHDVPAGLSLVGNILTVDPTNSAFNSLGVGASKILEVDYTISDNHGATVVRTETITMNGTNDSPVVSSLSPSSAAEGATAYLLDLLSGASDPDIGDTLSVGSVTYKIDGVLTGNSGHNVPEGLSLSGSMLTVNPQSTAFDPLKSGETKTIEVDYYVSDGHGGTIAQTETINITGVNDAPTSTDDSITTPDNAEKVLALSDFGVYHDAEGDALSSVTITSLPGSGSLEYSSDGTSWSVITTTAEILASEITAGHLKYIPVSGMATTTIGFHVSDGELTSPDYTLTVYAEHVEPLNGGSNSVGDTTVTVPSGIIAESSTIDGSGIDTAHQLSAFVDTLVTDTENHDNVHAQIDAYLSGQPSDTQVHELTLSGSSSGTISVDGNTSGHDVLVIDASNLPHGTVIDLNGVEFAVIIGPGNYGGGAGSNIVVADGSDQHIVLGPEDDTIHGGGGNDYVGSLGGNDKLYGDGDNDTLSGGQGNDSLDGGTGNDTIQFSGEYHDYHFSYDHGSDSWQVQDNVADRDGTDTVTGAEVFSFTDGNHNAVAHDCTVDVNYWKSGAGISGVSSTMTDNGNSQQTSATVNGGGQYSYAGLIEGDYTLGAVKSVGASEKNADKVSDVLAVLKIANGLSPNTGASTSTYQFLASDIDHNGKVQISDVLSILKMANNIPSAPSKEWIFVDQSAGDHTMTRNSIDWTVTDVNVNLNQDQDLHLIGVLKGDVDGSWAA
jgi:VCBS repeat-containing protein